MADKKTEEGVLEELQSLFTDVLHDVTQTLARLTVSTTATTATTTTAETTLNHPETHNSYTLAFSEYADEVNNYSIPAIILRDILYFAVTGTSSPFPFCQLIIYAQVSKAFYHAAMAISDKVWLLPLSEQEKKYVKKTISKHCLHQFEPLVPSLKKRQGMWQSDISGVLPEYINSSYFQSIQLVKPKEDSVSGAITVEAIATQVSGLFGGARRKAIAPYPIVRLEEIICQTSGDWGTHGTTYATLALTLDFKDCCFATDLYYKSSPPDAADFTPQMGRITQQANTFYYMKTQPGPGQYLNLDYPFSNLHDNQNLNLMELRVHHITGAQNQAQRVITTSRILLLGTEKIQRVLKLCGFTQDNINTFIQTHSTEITPLSINFRAKKYITATIDNITIDTSTASVQIKIFSAEAFKCLGAISNKMKVDGIDSSLDQNCLTITNSKQISSFLSEICQFHVSEIIKFMKSNHLDTAHLTAEEKPVVVHIDMNMKM